MVDCSLKLCTCVLLSQDEKYCVTKLGTCAVMVVKLSINNEYKNLISTKKFFNYSDSFLPFHKLISKCTLAQTRVIYDCLDDIPSS